LKGAAGFSAKVEARRKNREVTQLHGHFLQEERPEETFDELQHFFGTV